MSTLIFEKLYIIHRVSLFQTDWHKHPYPHHHSSSTWQIFHLESALEHLLLSINRTYSAMPVTRKWKLCKERQMCLKYSIHIKSFIDLLFLYGIIFLALPKVSKHIHTTGVFIINFYEVHITIMCPSERMRLLVSFINLWHLKFCGTFPLYSPDWGT